MTHNRTHTPLQRAAERTIVHRWEDVPTFQNECEEQEYWYTHELAADLFERRPPDPEEAAILERARRRRARSAHPAAG